MGGGGWGRGGMTERHGEGGWGDGGISTHMLHT